MRRVRTEAKDSLLSLLKKIEPDVVHRDTLRMIKEMATEAFPFHGLAPQDLVVDQSTDLATQASVESQQASYSSPSQHLDISVDFFQPLTPSTFHMDAVGPLLENIGDSSGVLEFPAYFDLSNYL